MCFARNSRPSYDQYWRWISGALPGGEKFHMFGLAAICLVTWKCHNKVCLDKKPLKNPSEIIFGACDFVHYWEGLHPVEAQQLIKVRHGGDDANGDKATGEAGC
jgi:hypothetical protein